MTITGQFFDGDSAAGHEVTITFSESFLTVQYLQNGFRKENSFRMTDLSVQKDGKTTILTFKNQTIILSAEVWKKYGTSPAENYSKLLIPGAMGFTLILSFLFFHDPIIEAAGRLVPDSMFREAEKEISDSYGKRNCLTAEQNRIIESVFLRLGKNRDEFTFYLVADPISNAFAVPGNAIVFHDSLLRELNSMEAFTGILAHEIAHLERDHLRKKVVKNLLFKWVWFAALGGDNARVIQTILAGRYDQAEEREADEVAARTLREAAIDPSGVRDYFANQGKKENAIAKYLVFTHPYYGDRVKTFAPAKMKYAPMSKADWSILKKGCQSNL